MRSSINHDNLSETKNNCSIPLVSQNNITVNDNKKVNSKFKSDLNLVNQKISNQNKNNYDSRINQSIALDKKYFTQNFNSYNCKSITINKDMKVINWRDYFEHYLNHKVSQGKEWALDFSK